MRGGSTRPLLSPWVMMMPPMIRVDTPQEVWKGWCRLVVLAGEGDVKGLGEAVAEVVAGAGLEGLAVVHHALDGVGRLGAGELLLVGLAGP